MEIEILAQVTKQYNWMQLG